MSFSSSMAALVFLLTAFPAAGASTDSASVAPGAAPKKTCPGFSEESDAGAQLDRALGEAGPKGKRVLAILGTSSCAWCKSLCEEMETPSIQRVLEAGYVRVDISVGGSDSKRIPASRLGLEGPPPIPFFVILDAKGSVLVHESTGPYETKGYGHDVAKIGEFLAKWGPAGSKPPKRKRSVGTAG